ncbi:MAG: hypothetical protein IJJ44_10155 [Solobacterium sp.]|nr:hypothetical protein [Solobacterium sp.]
MENKYYSYPEITNWGDPTVDAPDFRSGVVSLAKEQKWVAPYYNLEQMMHTITGESMMIAAELEKKYTDIRDQGLKDFWNNKGLQYEVHNTKGEDWLSFVPKSALEGNEKLPVMCAFRAACVFAQSFYYDMAMIAAQGEMILLIFSTEDQDENELWLDILKEAENIYPIDNTRVYLTGHSHYGEFALEFMRRHHEIIAAVAQQGDRPGLVPHFSDDAAMEKMHTFDCPVSIASGTAEMTQHFPLNTPAPRYDAWNERLRAVMPGTLAQRVSSWQRRLYGSRCETVTEEEMLACADSPNKALRVLGFPCDNAYTLWIDGVEVYVGDIKNVDGRYHLQVVAVENLSHTTCKAQHLMSWTFVRRFARDLENDLVVELYE